MDSGFYAACTALVSKTQALDIIANNLANSSSPGYRAQRGSFESVLAGTAAHSSNLLNQAVNNFGVLGGSNLDLTPGALEKTGNDLDLGISGSGFFVVQTPSGRYLTRNGAFQVSSEGQLITALGDPVMGESGAIHVAGGHVAVSEDGTISVNEAVAGKLKIVDFAAGTPIDSIGNGYYSGPARSEIPSADAQVHQGVLESSNVNPVMAAVQLIAVQRYAGLMQRALSMFHSEMNRTAVEDLPRVNSQ